MSSIVNLAFHYRSIQIWNIESTRGQLCTIFKRGEIFTSQFQLLFSFEYEICSDIHIDFSYFLSNNGITQLQFKQVCVSRLHHHLKNNRYENILYWSDLLSIRASLIIIILIAHLIIRIECELYTLLIDQCVTNGWRAAYNIAWNCMVCIHFPSYQLLAATPYANELKWVREREVNTDAAHVKTWIEKRK